MPRSEEFSHVPAGEHQKECPHCKIIFRTDDKRVKYCSLKCKKASANERYYMRYAPKIIDRVLSNRIKTD